MTVHLIPALKDNYQYLLICEQTGEAVAVDPCEAPLLAKRLRETGARLVAVWNTHHHWDHVGGNDELCDRFGVQALCSRYDFENARVPQAVRGLSEGDEVRVGQQVFRVLEIPGHTLGHIAFVGQGSVFCGDTLFSGGCGRLFEGTAPMLYASLQKLKDLADDTAVYCMHEYTVRNLEFALTIEAGNSLLQQRLLQVCQMRAAGLATIPSTLRDEKTFNPFLRTKSSEIRKNLAERGYGSLNDEVEIFRILRELKDQF